MRMLGIVCPVLIMAVAVHAEAQVSARTYPTKPIRLIVPVAPGGSLDVVSRSIGQKLGDNLGQSIVPDNRGGGGGSIGSELAARSPPDGYTVIMISATSVTHSLLYKARFDVRSDFTPVSQVTESPYLLVVHPSLPVRSVSELVAHAKSNPGKLNYASTGPGSLIHLASELFTAATRTQMVHVPYKGMGTAYPDLIAGRIQLTFAGNISAAPYLRAQKLRPLAVTGAQRAKFAPELPTVSETGVPGFAVMQWYGLLAPAGTPRSIVERLHREIANVLKLPEVITRLQADGSEVVASSPQQFAAHIKSEYERWAQVIKQADVHME